MAQVLFTDVPAPFIEKIATSLGWVEGVNSPAEGLALFKQRVVFLMKRDGARVDYELHTKAFLVNDPDITP